MSGLLKFITCGSVDDGKSTLIGHILYDSKLLYADQEKALELDSKVGSRGGAIDYSLLLDGLMAEREQGITIDVAYRYFTTDKIHLIYSKYKITDSHQCTDSGMSSGLYEHALLCIHKDNGKVCKGCTDCHVSCVLLMSRSISNDKTSVVSCKISGSTSREKRLILFLFILQQKDLLYTVTAISSWL